jgi:Skp family chaperone for outer membrane proteins
MLKTMLRGVFVVGWLVASVTCGWCGDMKIATVDAERLLKNYHKIGQAETHMKEQLQDFSKEEEKMLAERRRMKKDFETARAESGNRVLNEEARDKRMELAENKLLELMEYENRIRETGQSRQKQFADEQRRLLRQLVADIRVVVKDYAKKNGYQLVLDASGVSVSGIEPVVYAEETTDITADIEKLLNKDQVREKVKTAE